jgi:hypothetical protein
MDLGSNPNLLPLSFSARRRLAGDGRPRTGEDGVFGGAKLFFRGTVRPKSSGRPWDGWRCAGDRSSCLGRLWRRGEVIYSRKEIKRGDFISWLAVLTGN